MSQGLQLSIMLTGTDTAQKAQRSLSDADSAAQGVVFGEMLGDMVQPAKKGQGQMSMRQLPAAISMLSGVSQAMLSSSEADSAAAADTQTDMTALAASILGQIALKEQTVPDDAALASAAELNTDMLASADSNKAAADKAASQIAAALSASDSKGANKNAATPANTISPDAALSASDSLTSAADDASAAKQAQQAEKGETIAISTLKQQVQQAKAELDSAVDTSDEAVDKNPIKQALLASEAKADVAIAAAPSQSGQALHSGQALSSGQAIDAAAFTQAADGELTGVDENAQHSIAQPADTQGINAAKTADNAQKTADVAAVTTGNGMLTPQPVTGAGDITPVAAAISAHEPGSLSADVKTPSSILQAEKATVKAGAESLASGAKPGNNEQHGQQQPRQNSASTQQLDAQPLLAEPHTLTTKASTDTTSANRFETVFANNLHAQEQRQHSALSQSQAKSATEQLTQNLNLQQQDAAGQLRERVNLMVRQNIQVAEIRLDPAGLGKMQIKLDMQQDQAQVQFIVQQSQAKELLEQQLPRLRELLQQQGIVLTEGNVQQQSQHQERQLAQRQGDGGRAGQQAQSGDDETDTAATAVQITARHSEQLVDYYA